MFITRTAFVSASGPYTDSILGKNIDSFLATTSSQACTHFPMQWYWMLGVKLQKREADHLYLVRRSNGMRFTSMPSVHLYVMFRDSFTLNETKLQFLGI
jgi:hypothetical protein